MIKKERLLQRLEEMASIAGSPTRIALTDADKQGRDLLVKWMRLAGLDVKIDAIGNIFGLRAGTDATRPAIMTGSHIDTVGNPGKLDGMLGVLAGLEIVDCLNEQNLTTGAPICVAAFTNEEGVRFQPDMMGSLVHVGGLSLEDALNVQDRDGVSVAAALKAIGYAGPMQVGDINPAAFVELHIEQGPVLDSKGIKLGAVENLQGISWQEISIKGQANHAGTTPMNLRRDPGFAAARIVTFLRELANELGGAQVATVGTIEFKPNLINVIPHSATLTVDLRNTNEEILAESENRLSQFLELVAKEERVLIETKRLARFQPVDFDPELVEKIELAAQQKGHKILRMTSGAGHDAQMMARVCPSAMIFVPSIAGISHNPAEATDVDDIVLGVEVLNDVILGLAK